ncbi:MAG TPA: 6,7-dimethyl-8-ribityllumazine synthase [Dongiaceae bacterium]|nr:6,7-dimethyl-8-ribityllumazine synthase [Dongiaceae bacterium]
MTEAPRIMVAEARFYPDIADALAGGALAALNAAGAAYERFEVPGVFEIPAAIRMAVRANDAGRRRFDGYLALGCVIRGETSHYDYVCQESARALQDLACRFALALGYGILTVENADQAWARARADGKDRGGHAARACLAMLELRRRFDPSGGL